MYKDTFPYPPRSNSESSLLTAPIPPEIAAEMRRKEEMVERARILVLDVWLEGYKAGQVTLEKLCRNSRRALLRVPEGHRQRALGQMLDTALTLDVPRRGRGNKGEPSVLKDLCLRMVTIAAEEYGLPISRGSKKKTTAYGRVAEILADLGVAVTPRQIEEWRSEVAE